MEKKPKISRSKNGGDEKNLLKGFKVETCDNDAGVFLYFSDRGKREDMIHEPKKLTEALDILLTEVKKLHKPDVSGSLPCHHNYIQKDAYWKSCPHCGMIAPL